MPMIRAMRLLGALENGTTTGTELESLLSDGGRLGEFRVLMGLRGQATRLAASGVATAAIGQSAKAANALAASPVASAALVKSVFGMNGITGGSAGRNAIANTPSLLSLVRASDIASVKYTAGLAGLNPENYDSGAALAASSTAMNAIITSPAALAELVISLAAMAAVAASASAMTTVAASSVAMAAVLGSSVAKMALFNSDAAIAAISGSSTALAAIRTNAKYATYTHDSGLRPNQNPALIGPVLSGSYIAVGVSTTDTTTGQTITVTTLRSGSSRTNTHVADATSVSSAAALGVLCMPMVAPFAINSTDGSSGPLVYVGMLRCDV